MQAAVYIQMVAECKPALHINNDNRQINMKRVETVILNLLYAGRCPVLTNRCYGGFSLSLKAIRAYNSECAPDNLLSVCTHTTIARTDRLLAKIYTHMLDEANGAFAKLDICWVDDRFEAYVNINEHDGYESVSIDFQKYQLDSIKEITGMPINDIEKLDRIQHVFVESQPTFLDLNGNLIGSGT